MGIFDNSNTKEKKEQILRDISVINFELKKLINIVDNSGGINNTSIKLITPIIEDIEQFASSASTTIQSMSDSELAGFNVPWIDDKHLGVMDWMFNLQTSMQKIISEIERKYGL